MYSCPNPMSRRGMIRLVTLAVILSVAASALTPTAVLAATTNSRRQPTTTLPTSSSSTTNDSRLASSTAPTPSQPDHRLLRRVPLDIISSDIVWNEPPIPTDWINGLPPPPSPSPRPRPRPSTTTADEKPFPVQPSNDPGIGHSGPPQGLSPANHGNQMPGQPDKHAIDLSKLEPAAPPKEKRPSDSTSLAPGPEDRIGLLNTPDFIDIWSAGNLPPQPGTPIPDDPPLPSPPPPDNDRPPTPTTQPGGGGGNLTDLPLAPAAATVTPLFNAIPVIPPALVPLNPALSNITDGKPPTTVACGDGWCSVAESCASCPKDCSVSHLDKFGFDRLLQQAKSPLFRPDLDPKYLTFNCGAPQFAQFCPLPTNSTVAGNSRKQSAMLAIVGSHPSPYTTRLPDLLATVPASAVAVFLDVQLLTWPKADPVAMRKSINLLRFKGYLLGLALGSTSIPTANALSTTSILRAHQVYAHLPAWLALSEGDTTTLSSHISSSRDFAPALPTEWPPLYLTTDPNSSYYQALTPAIAQLLHVLSTRIVLPSVPIYDHLNTDTKMNAAELAVDSLARTMRLRPGVPGWIIGLDASGEKGEKVARRVVEEVGARAEWARATTCFEFRDVPGEPGDGKAERRTVKEVVEVVRRRAGPAVPAYGWQAEVDAEAEGVGREVREVTGEEDGW